MKNIINNLKLGTWFHTAGLVGAGYFSFNSFYDGNPVAAAAFAVFALLVVVSSLQHRMIDGLKAINTALKATSEDKNAKMQAWVKEALQNIRLLEVNLTMLQERLKDAARENQGLAAEINKLEGRIVDDVEINRLKERIKLLEIERDQALSAVNAAFDQVTARIK